MSAPGTLRRWLWWMAAYVVLLVAVVLAMAKARQWAIAQLSTPESTAAWQEWREDVERQQTERSPVQRRVPKSDEPPALVLMRDSFAVTMIGAVLFTSMLYWVMAWFISGMIQSGVSR
jgi:hypothetical protein